MPDLYRTIVADPPWAYRSPGQFVAPETEFFGSAGSARRYGAMNMAELQAITVPAEDDAHLYLWTTNAFMVEAHDLARGWGFEPKTVLTWGKVQADGRPSMKMGHYFRGATEHVVFAVRGSLKLQTSEGLPTLYLWPRLPHSVKPDAFYDLVEKASPGPYLELFARRARFGWEYWGDESLGTTEMTYDCTPCDARHAFDERCPYWEEAIAS
jgi:N6-adenosine-specific RNA methylase IME4